MSLERQKSGLGLGNTDTLIKAISQIPYDDPTFNVRKDLQEQWEKQDNLEQAQAKAQQLKQRFEGLRKGTTTPARPPGSKPQPEAKIFPHDSVSESTEGCSIYLEKSVGDMSEITNYVASGED